MVFHPSPSQSPAATANAVEVSGAGINVIASFTGATITTTSPTTTFAAAIGTAVTAATTTITNGHELNATLVGSNNIQLHKVKDSVNKRKVSIMSFISNVKYRNVF